MNVKYGLSNRQAKELLDRGRPLRIAVPAPDQEEYDPRRWLAEVMPEVEPGWIVSAQERVLPVNPLGRHTASDEQSLVGLLGRIVHDRTERPPNVKVTVLVVCVVAELQAQRVARQRPGLLEWAGRIIE